jgi:hypothetical protein
VFDVCIVAAKAISVVTHEVNQTTTRKAVF